MNHIIIVEDNREMNELLSLLFIKKGYSVTVCPTFREGMALSEAFDSGLWIIDLRLPDGNGLDLCRRIRAKSRTPILILTATDEEKKVVDCLEAGADDYVTKPFRALELLARVSALLRRSASPHAPAGMSSAPLFLNTETQYAYIRGGLLNLTPMEFRILALLLRTHGRLVTR